MSSTSAPSTRRLDWLDAFRGLAVLWMIETHCRNTFLAPAWQGAGWQGWLNYANGLVAPGFLFIAGFAQGLSSRREWQKTTPPPSLRPRLQRLGLILLIGYALHFPWNALFAMPPDLGAQILRGLGQVDILHCLAVSLALLLLTARWLRGRAWEGLWLGITLLVLLTTPLLWNWQMPVATAPLLSFLSPQFGALFPLFPWLAFASFGAIASRWSGNKPALLLGVLICWLLAWGFTFSPSPWSDTPAFAARPGFVFQRLGWVLLVAVVFLSLPRLAGARWLAFAGRQSLFLYVIHLQILYADWGWLPPLQKMIGPTQPPAIVGLLFLGIGTLSLLLAWGWSRSLAGWRCRGGCANRLERRKAADPAASTTVK